MPILYATIGLMIFGLGYAIGRTSATEPLPECCLTCLHKHKCRCLNFTGVCCDHYGFPSRFEELTANHRLEVNNAYGKGYRDGMLEEHRAYKFDRAMKNGYDFEKKHLVDKLGNAIKSVE